MPNGKLKISAKELTKLFKQIHSGVINLINLPEDLYVATGNELTEAMFRGLKVSPGIDLQQPANNSARIMKKSLFSFSAAKQFQFISDMQNFLFDEAGLIRPFNEFRKFANVINNAYNKNWLEAEYVTSINMSRGAADWERIQDEKDIFPFLQYTTVGDANVRDEHVVLNGIIRRVDDQFWSDFMPPNGWRCRCDAIQLENGAETDLRKVNKPKLDPVFDGNSGKRNTVFKKSHDYFKVPNQWRSHKANNFGLDFPTDTNEPK